MKTVLLIHGWLSTPKMHFFPWLKKELETRGYTVVAPQMPNPALPKRAEWLATLSDMLHAIDRPEETILLGHSLGTLTILHYLNEIHQGAAFPHVVLCSGFGRAFSLPQPIDIPRLNEYPKLIAMREKILALPEVVLRDWFEPTIDFDRVRHLARRWTCIHAPDDPVVPYAEGVYAAQQLGATFVEETNGHLIEFRVNGRMALPSALEAIVSTEDDLSA